MDKVLRPFEADGVLLQAGAIVDTSSWKNRDKLIRYRYITPHVAPVSVPPTAPALTSLVIEPKVSQQAKAQAVKAEKKEKAS